MSSHQEKSKETMTPVPDVTAVSDDKDEEVVDLEAVARLVKAKLDQDLAVVLGKFGLVWSGAIFAGPETGQSGPRRNFWDRDRRSESTV